MAAYIDILRVDLTPEQQGCTLTGGQQPRQDFHGRGLATTVGAQKAENLATRDAKTHVIHCREIAEANSDVLRLDCDFGIVAEFTLWDFDIVMPFSQFFRQKRDKGSIEIGSIGTLQQFLRRTRRQYLTVIHRD